MANLDDLNPANFGEPRPGYLDQKFDDFEQPLPPGSWEQLSKRRRRPVLWWWLPPVVLLLSGGAWWGANQYQNEQRNADSPRLARHEQAARPQASKTEAVDEMEDAPKPNTSSGYSGSAGAAASSVPSSPAGSSSSKTMGESTMDPPKGTSVAEAGERAAAAQSNSKESKKGSLGNTATVAAVSRAGSSNPSYKKAEKPLTASARPRPHLLKGEVQGRYKRANSFVSLRREKNAGVEAAPATPQEVAAGWSSAQDLHAETAGAVRAGKKGTASGGVDTPAPETVAIAETAAVKTVAESSEPPAELPREAESTVAPEAMPAFQTPTVAAAEAQERPAVPDSARMDSAKTDPVAVVADSASPTDAYPKHSPERRILWTLAVLGQYFMEDARTTAPELGRTPSANIASRVRPGLGVALEGGPIIRLNRAFGVQPTVGAAILYQHTDLAAVPGDSAYVRLTQQPDGSIMGGPKPLAAPEASNQLLLLPQAGLQLHARLGRGWSLQGGAQAVMTVLLADKNRPGEAPSPKLPQWTAGFRYSFTRHLAVQGQGRWLSLRRGGIPGVKASQANLVGIGLGLHYTW